MAHFHARFSRVGLVPQYQWDQGRIKQPLRRVITLKPRRSDYSIQEGQVRVWRAEDRCFIWIIGDTWQCGSPDTSFEQYFSYAGDLVAGTTRQYS
ncbi:hypothetical protein FRC03_010613 [Tulasnella sp. 419]|nr:hypothetical protein FRC03_010613 [Tulasnella sp. 419]